MSSDIADEVNIPEGFTVEADVTDCEMNSTFTVALTEYFQRYLIWMMWMDWMS